MLQPWRCVRAYMHSGSALTVSGAIKPPRDTSHSCASRGGICLAEVQSTHGDYISAPSSVVPQPARCLHRATDALRVGLPLARQQASTGTQAACCSSRLLRWRPHSRPYSLPCITPTTPTQHTRCSAPLPTRQPPDAGQPHPAQVWCGTTAASPPTAAGAMRLRHWPHPWAACRRPSGWTADLPAPVCDKSRGAEAEGLSAGV
jgi:hypothetical protein